MNYDNKKIIVSVSGGKDSTAMCLNLLEQGYSTSDFIRVFADTGWESKETYRYLDELEKTIGKIHRVKAEIPIRQEHKQIVKELEDELGFESSMIRYAIRNQTFPSRNRKWCTTKLKIEPMKKFFDEIDDDFVNLVGIRKEESPKRSKMTKWEYSDYFDCWVHRPLMDWTEKDVIDIHHRFNLIPNRLYLNGSNRVGCYPCIYSRKSEIKNIPIERIKFISKLEKIFTKLRNDRKGDDVVLTFFTPRVKGTTLTIEDVFEWSQTVRGGVQFELFDTEEPTCIKWGMCGV